MMDANRRSTVAKGSSSPRPASTRAELGVIWPLR
jgi:hypothetical protein